MPEQKKVIYLVQALQDLLQHLNFSNTKGTQHIVIKKEIQASGLSRTINYKGNLIDIGGHRFFSKSEKVMTWWTDMFPLDTTPDRLLKKISIDQDTAEMVSMGFIKPEDVLDATVIKVPKAYPVYSGAYENFALIRTFLDNIQNLFPIGRNGMHRYNNQDHSMLTAMETVDNIVNGVMEKSNIWNVNTEESYHETK